MEIMKLEPCKTNEGNFTIYVGRVLVIKGETKLEAEKNACNPTNISTLS